MEKIFKREMSSFPAHDGLPTRNQEAVKVTYNSGEEVVNIETITSCGHTKRITGTPVQLTQAQYDALTTKDPNTIYAILG